MPGGGRPVLWSLVAIGPIITIGVVDLTQTRQAVRRNFPVVGHGRYLLEKIRPEINQYFVESNSDGKPFSRDCSVVYQRAKGELDTLPFGTPTSVRGGHGHGRRPFPSHHLQERRPRNGVAADLHNARGVPRLGVLTDRRDHRAGDRHRHHHGALTPEAACLLGFTR